MNINPTMPTTEETPSCPDCNKSLMSQGGTRLTLRLPNGYREQLESFICTDLEGCNGQLEFSMRSRRWFTYEGKPC